MYVRHAPKGNIDSVGCVSVQRRRPNIRVCRSDGDERKPAGKCLWTLLKQEWISDTSNQIEPFVLLKTFSQEPWPPWGRSFSGREFEPEMIH